MCFKVGMELQMLRPTFTWGLKPLNVSLFLLMQRIMLPLLLLHVVHVIVIEEVGEVRIQHGEV